MCRKKLRPRCWPEETTTCYKISLVQWGITNLIVILYLSTCHTVHISVLILFMIMPQLIINTYVCLMYELKKIGKVFTSKSVGTGPSSYGKRIYRAAVSQKFRHTGWYKAHFMETDKSVTASASKSSEPQFDSRCWLCFCHNLDNNNNNNKNVVH